MGVIPCKCLQRRPKVLAPANGVVNVTGDIA